MPWRDSHSHSHSYLLRTRTVSKPVRLQVEPSAFPATTIPMRQMCSWAQSGEAWNAKLSSLPREYYTLQVEFGPPTLDSIPYRGPSLGRPGMRNCHPYRGNTTLCTSSLGHGPWIQAPTAGLAKGGLEHATIILTAGILHFAPRVWGTDHGFKHQPRG